MSELGSARRSGRPRWMPFAVVAIYALCVGLLGFYTELVRPLPNPTRAVTGWKWWFTPLEQNAFLRMPCIAGELRGMDVSRDGQVIAIVSSEDAIFTSLDAGRTWIRGGLETVAAAEPAPKGAFNWRFGLHSVAQAEDGSSTSNLAPKSATSETNDAARAKSASRKEPNQAAAPRDAKAKQKSDSVPATTTMAPQPSTPDVRDAPDFTATGDEPKPKRGLFDVSVLDDHSFVAVGEQGLILRTVDAGKTWTDVRSGTSLTLRSVACSGNACMAVGEQSVIARSTDAGATWRISLGGGFDRNELEQRELRTPPELLAIARVSGDRWVAVGERGALLRLNAEGQPTSHEFLGARAFFDVAFDAASGNGMVVGVEVFATRNGGASWEHATAPYGSANPGQLSRVVFDSAGAALAVGLFDVHVYSTRDLGKQWQAQVVGSTAVGRSTGQYTRLWSGLDRWDTDSGRERLAIDAQGRAFFLRGDDSLFVRPAAGEWTQLALGETNFSDLAMLTSTRGIIVGAAGTLLSTDDGGDTWVPLESGVRADMLSIASSDAKHALAVGLPNVVLRTSDAGAHWSSTELPEVEGLRSVQFADAQHVFAYDGDQDWHSFSLNPISLGRPKATALFESRDGGLSWSRKEQPANEYAYRELGFADPTTGVMGRAGSLGLWLRGTKDAGSTWRLLGPGHLAWVNLMGRTRYALFEADSSERAKYGALEFPESAGSLMLSASSVAFADSEVGLVIPWAGADSLQRTTDGGATWTAIPSPTRAPLIAARFASKNRVIALAQGRVIVSDDAGKSFRSVSYRRSPSPWLWLASLSLFAGLFVYARRTINAPALDRAPASIADAAASDRPIQWWDPDHAGLREIALGLSRFLRNRKTEPPLTVAITGEWGTGKSSLMNLLRHDLTRYGYRPVWFNAWHHQSGENLLASLLANIHAQGVPSFLSLAGLDFRVSLTAIRARRLWLQVTLTLVVFAVVLFSYPVLKENWFSFWSSLTSKDTSDVSSLKAASGLIGIAVSVLTPFLSVARVVGAFGLQPAKLIAAVASTGADESARQQAGARYRFAREFEDFTRALEPRPLVIFIDDLDRCRAPNVVEVLEAINFLVSSGRCVVVMGMARRWVETCVGLAFQELAHAHTEQEGATPSGKSERQLFARQYLEKLINIEVRVPALSNVAASAMLQGMQPEALHHDARYALGTFLLRGLRWVGLLLGLGAIAALAFCIAQLFKDVGPARDPVAQAPVQLQTPTAAAEVGETRPNPEAASLSQRSSELRELPTSLEQADAPAPAPFYWVSGLLLAVLPFAALVALALFARREAQTEDSPAFRSALGVMHPFIVLGGSSPRSLKRFVNQVRYIAMRSRASVETLTASERLGQRVRSFFGRSSQFAPFAPPQQHAPLPEELLVALAALHRCGEHWLEALFVSDQRQDLLDFLQHELSQRFKDQPAAQLMAEELWVAMGKLNGTFTSAALLSDALQARRCALQFLALMANEAHPTSERRDSSLAASPNVRSPEAGAG